MTVAERGRETIAAHFCADSWEPVRHLVRVSGVVSNTDETNVVSS
jgi:hypothetical protein